MLRGATKLSVVLPDDLASEVRKRVGPKGLPRFVARAVRHEIERSQLGDYLTELSTSLGPVPARAMAAARAAWPKR